MTFIARAAAIVALTLSIAGIVAPGSAAQAAEVASAALTAPAAAILNIPAPVPVPARPKPAEAVELNGATMQPGDAIAYPTLAAAVAAQDVTGDAGEDLRCLAASIYFESKGEPLAGQLAVAQVILNRAETRRFGTGICGVVRQPGQFSFVRGGRIPDIDEDRATYRTALAVAKVAMAEAWDSPAPKALYFNSRRAGGFAKTRVASIGNHIFYR